MNHKVRVLVHLDLDCASATIEVRGNVTNKSVQALYVVTKRANALLPGLQLMLDVTHAHVEDGALEQLHACSAAGRLPAHIDPVQQECRLRILDPVSTGAGAQHVQALAA